MSVNSFSIQADVTTNGARVEVKVVQHFTFAEELPQEVQETILTRIATSDLKQVIREHLMATLTGGGSRSL